MKLYIVKCDGKTTEYEHYRKAVRAAVSLVTAMHNAVIEHEGRIVHEFELDNTGFILDINSIKRG